MASSSERLARADAEDAHILDARERLAFDRLLQWLRLSFLLTPITVLIAYGAAAVPYALLITIAIAMSFGGVSVLSARQPTMPC